MPIFLTFLLFANCNCLNINIFYKYLKKNVNQSLACQLQKKVFLKSLESRETWALKSKYFIKDKCINCFLYGFSVKLVWKCPSSYKRGKYRQFWGIRSMFEFCSKNKHYHHSRKVLCKWT